MEKQRVIKCRENWKYDTLADTVEIKLLMQDAKGHYDTASWPNFFIGINKTGDTIGIVEYNAERTFKKGTWLKFIPSKKKDSLLELIDSEWDEPVLRISPLPEENDLYCSVTVIYYGTLIE